jgi:hypothetical protein
MTTRRQFVITLLPAATAMLALSRTAQAQAAKVEETDPTAIALGYKHDATKVDAKKFPTFVAGRNCSNCQLYQGKPTDAWAPCAIFAGKQVNAKGWCSAWAKKA